MKNKFLLFCLSFVIASALIARTEADLKSDLREFGALVPKRQISYIAARHYILDVQFGKALKYLQSEQFTKTYRKIRSSEEFKNILESLTTNRAAAAGIAGSSGVPLSTLQDVITGIVDKLPNQLRSYRLPSKVPVTMMMQRNLMSFMREVMQIMPRAKFTGLMARKVSEDGDFAKLYKAMQQKEFKELVEKLRVSSNLQPSWNEMAQHHIQINGIIEHFYEILNWGP